MENDSPLQEIVGRNFEEIVRDQQKDVFIQFYAPWSGDCKKLEPIWEELASSFNEVSNLYIARMDATSNEAEGIHISGYPTFMFFPKENKEGIYYTGNKDLESFKIYLQENSLAIKEYNDSFKHDL